MSPRPASAAFISLTTPVTGTNTPGDLIGLTVSFDPNGSPAANVVSMDLYVAFTGLTPVGYMLGDIFTPYTSDPSFFALERRVRRPLHLHVSGWDARFARYVSGVRQRAHAARTDRAGHALHHAVRRRARRFGVVAERLRRSDFGLLWDPTPDEVCDFEDPNCDPSVPPIPFALVLPDGAVPDGLSRVTVGVNAPPGQEDPDPPGPTPVPEPASLMLLGAGLLAVAAHHRRRRR